MPFNFCTIFSLDAENDGERVFLVFFHFSPREVNKLIEAASSDRKFGNGCKKTSVVEYRKVAKW